MTLPWINRIDEALSEMDEISLLASRALLDPKAFSQILSDKFETKLEIRLGETKWLTFDEIHSGIGAGADFIPFTISPISGEVFWIMNEEDTLKLTSLLLLKDDSSEGFSSKVLTEGYYHYLLLEALDAFQKMPNAENLSPKMNMHASLPHDGALAIDVEIKYLRKSVWGRLLLPKEFRKSWHTYFEQLMPDPFHSELATKCALTFGLKIGSCHLDKKTISKLSAGDFVLLDNISYDIRTETGSAMMMLNTHPLMQLSIQGNQCTIVEEAIYQEENRMENVPPEDEFKDDLPPLDDDLFNDETEAPVSEAVEEEEEEEEEYLSLKNVPLTLTVEMSRIKMSLAKLMKLEPGNLIELPSHPNKAVSLTIEGKKVGTAELVHLGEALGVRILEIGKK